MPEKDQSLAQSLEQKEKILKKIEKNDSLLDILMQVEDFFDSLDLYVFKNWINGEVIDGPYIKRYFIRFVLKWAYEEMPDPNGAIRLLRNNCKIKFEKAQEMQPVEIESPSDYRADTKRPKSKKVPIWLVEVTIPRRFIEEKSDDLDLYDEEVDTDDIEDAQDTGMDSTNAYVENEEEDEIEDSEESTDEEENE